jgi:hypothetical protein
MAAYNKKNSIAISYEKFNVDTDFGYTKVRPNKAGGKSVGIIRDGSQLIVSTPLMMCWGAQEMVSPDGGRTTYSLSLQFPNSQYPNEEASKLFEKMKAFEERIKRDAVKHSKEWLGKANISAEGVDLLFNPMLSWSIDKSTGERNPERAPTLRIKLDKWPGRDGGESKFDCELYDGKNPKPIFPDPNDDEITPLDLIPPNSHVACAIKCGGLYFVNGKFGVTWRLFQAVVKPRESIRGTCCIQLSAADKEKVEEADDESDSEEAVVKDDEDETEEATEEATAEEATETPSEDQTEEPAPEPKKKITRRKKDAAP